MWNLPFKRWERIVEKSVTKKIGPDSLSTFEPGPCSDQRRELPVPFGAWRHVATRERFPPIASALPDCGPLFTSRRDFTLTRRRISGRNWSGQSS